MKNPLSLQSRRAARAYMEGLSDVFRLSAEDLAKKQAEKHAMLDSSVKYALAMPLVQPCYGSALPPSAIGKYIRIRQAEKKSYHAGVERGFSIKAYLEMV